MEHPIHVHNYPSAINCRSLHMKPYHCISNYLVELDMTMHNFCPQFIIFSDMEYWFDAIYYHQENGSLKCETDDVYFMGYFFIFFSVASMRFCMGSRRAFICRMKYGSTQPDPLTMGRFCHMRNRSSLVASKDGEQHAVVHCTGYIKNWPPSAGKLRKRHFFDRRY